MEVNNVWTKSLLPTPVDFLIIILYLLILFIIGLRIKKRNIYKNKEYKFFFPGLFFKIFGGIIFCLVYIFYYYEIGDTILYYRSSEALCNLFFKDPSSYFSIMFGNLSASNYLAFDNYTGYPIYYTDSQAFSVVRFINPFLFISFKNYFTATVLLSIAAYMGIWKMFQMFCKIYPGYNKFFAITILFLPSVLFWGSGILKDTFTLSASCWYTYNFYKIIIDKKNIIVNIILMIVNIFIILSLKPYIIVALFPGTLIWGLYYQIIKIKNFTAKLIISPLIILSAIIIAYFAYNLFKENLGNYSNTESIIKKAQITQQDLIRSQQYGMNYYDIGEFKTNADIIRKIPKAIIAGLYRPFIWESNTIFMVISGIENFIILILTFYVFIGVGGPFRCIKILIKDPLLLFVFLFSILFAFSIGLSTANFGALVRYRIPLLPFFTSGLMILYIKKKYSK